MHEVIVIKEHKHKKKGGAKRRTHHRRPKHGDGFFDAIKGVASWAKANQPLGKINAALNATGLSNVIASNPIGSAILKGVQLGAAHGYGRKRKAPRKKRHHVVVI